MSDTPRRPVVLDLSTRPGTPGKRRRTGPPPVVVQTLNLSTPRASAPAPPETPAPAPLAAPSSAARSRRGGEPSSRPAPARGGARLAELLDEATLARLKGSS